MGMEVPTPNEIIAEILSNLGKNDLLKCRLVSQSWNELSLKILRNPKYGHEHELTQDNIQKFIEFSIGRNEEWVLPFHLNFDRTSYGKFKLYPQIPNHILTLQTIFGEKCVGGLTLRDNSVEMLISILTLISPSLIHLDLSQFKLRYGEQEEKTKAKEMLAKTDLNFPNLSKLKSSAPNYWIEQGIQKVENKIHSFIIGNSQHLQELEVVSPYDLLVIEKQIRSLRKLKILKPFAMRGLDIGTILEPVRTSLPVLKDLTLTYCTGALVQLDHKILYEFLSSFSTSLQSLRVVCEVGRDEILTNPFPRLSHLKYLRIQTTLPRGFTPNPSRRWVNLEKLNLNSETFPVLESMDIPAKIYFESETKSGHSKDDWILPTIKKLIIRMTDSTFNGRLTAKAYVTHLQHLFPNVTSLTLKSDWFGNEEYFKQLIIAFTQSDGAPRIQELDIQNCGRNYLGHILNLNGLNQKSETQNRNGVFRGVITCKAPIHFKMTGLEKIRMSFSKKRRHNYGQLGHVTSENVSNQKDLFLMSLPKHLPLLRQIDISQQMFGYAQDFCKQQIIHVQGEFPHLIINTTL